MTDRSKRPAYQWYPGDFRRDLAVQACSWEARSLWRDMLDFMHDGEPYGHLTAGGVPLQPATLARLVGVSARRATAWLSELESRGVFSRTEGGVIYSRRMVRDEAQRQQHRDICRQGGSGQRRSGKRQLRRRIRVDVARRIFERDRTCLRCGSEIDLHLDHITPWSQGGSDSEDNLQVLCGPCNRWKRTRVISFVGARS